MINIKSIEKKYFLLFGAFILAMIVFVGTIFFIVSNNKSQKEILELENLSTAIRNFYKNRPNYWGLDNNFAIKNNLFTKTENGKEIIIGQSFAGYKVMPGNTTFDIVYKGLGNEECISLLSLELSESQKIVLLSISIQGMEEKTFDWGSENSLPISKNTAKKMCKKDYTNNILWTFK